MSTLAPFDSIADALDAAAVVPCGPLCAGVHVIAWQGTAGRTECQLVGHTRQPRSLAEELRLAGYHRPDGDGPSPQYWPTPSILNGRLRR